MSTEQTTLIRYTGLMPLDGPGVVPLVWSKEKPTVPGWYWIKKDGRISVAIITAFPGYERQNELQATPLHDDGRMSFGRMVILCQGSEWCPIPQPGPAPTMAAQHFYRVEEVEALIEECVPSNWCDPLLAGENRVIGDCPYNGNDIEELSNGVRKRLLDRLRGEA